MRFWGRKKEELPEKTAPKLRHRYKVGLALSGGGAKGIAHVGVIRAFKETGLDFDFVAGTSVGSLVGAAYCAGISWEEMAEFCRSVKEKDIRNSRSVFFPSESRNIERLAYRLLGGKNFNELKTPFACNAVNLATGEERIFTRGNLAKAISASCSVPVIFSGVDIEGEHYVDGGLLNTIPSDIARCMGADYVVAVDLNPTRGEGTSSRRLLSVFWATFNIAMKSTAYKGIMNTDVMIEPDLKRFKSTKLEGVDEMIEEGYRAALEQMPVIKLMLGAK